MYKKLLIFCSSCSYVLSKRKDVEKVVNLFSFEDNYPLIGFGLGLAWLGYKKDSYEIWLKALKNKNSSRYKDLILSYLILSYLILNYLNNPSLSKVDVCKVDVCKVDRCTRPSY